MLFAAMVEPITGEAAAMGLSVQSEPASRCSRTASGMTPFIEAGSTRAATAPTSAPAAKRPNAAQKKRASAMKVPGKSARKNRARALPRPARRR
jgi:hypothetical protein